MAKPIIGQIFAGHRALVTGRFTLTALLHEG